MAFDPDEFLASRQTEFDPDVFLAERYRTVPELETQVVEEPRRKPWHRRSWEALMEGDPMEAQQIAGEAAEEGIYNLVPSFEDVMHPSRPAHGRQFLPREERTETEVAQAAEAYSAEHGGQGIPTGSSFGIPPEVSGAGIKGVYNALVDTVNFFNSPEGGVALASGNVVANPAAHRLLAMGFSSYAVTEAIKSAMEGRWGDAVENLILGGAAGHGARKLAQQEFPVNRPVPGTSEVPLAEINKAMEENAQRPLESQADYVTRIQQEHIPITPTEPQPGVQAPPIPPQYAERRFTMPPEQRTQTAEVPPIFETLKQIPPTPAERAAAAPSQAIVPAERGFTLQPEPRPELAPAPSIEETLTKTEPAPVETDATTRQTLDILARRQTLLSERERIRALQEKAKQVTPRGDPVLEAELAAIDAELNNRVTNPVVHAPPQPRTGVTSETARVPGAGVRADFPPMEPAPAVQGPSELRTNVPSETARVQGQAQEGPAKAPGGTPSASEPAPGVPVAEPPIPAAETRYAGPQAVREALRQQVLKDQATRLRIKANNKGGFSTMHEALYEFGKQVYREGMDSAAWVSEMVKHLGREVVDHLSRVWDDMQKLHAVPKGFRGSIKMGVPEDFNKVDVAKTVLPPEGSKPAVLTSVDSGGTVRVGEFEPDLRVVPKLLETAPKEEANLYRTKNILGTGADPKTVKGEKYGVTTYISYLAAEKGSKVVNMCVFATEKCVEGCLGKGGNARYDTVVQGRINKTKYFAYDPVTYMKQLDGEIGKAKKKAVKAGNVLAIRLNGTSDVLWEKSGILERHPDVQFYDYTKYPRPLRKNLPPNYHLTYSYTGTPASDAFSKTWNEHGVNTAVVFRDGMPARFLDRPVIDGDVSDLRFLDPDNVIVGLHAKGKLLLRDEKTGNYIETNEFVYDTPPDQVAIPYFDPRQKADILKTEFLGEEALGSMKDIAPKAGDLKWKRGNPDLGLNEPGATPELSPIQAFRQRLQERRAALKAEGRRYLGFDPEDTALQAAIGGTYIAEGIVDFARWSDAMVKEFGPEIKPHLNDLYKAAQDAHDTFQKTGQYAATTQPSRQEPAGIANVYLERDIKSGALPASALVQGQGTTPAIATARARDLLAKDPGAAFEAAQRVNRGEMRPDDPAILNAYNTQLAETAAQAAKESLKNPGNQQLKDAADIAEGAHMDFLQTVLPKAKGQVQKGMVGFQGATPPDYSTYAGMLKELGSYNKGEGLTRPQRMQLYNRENKVKTQQTKVDAGLTKMQKTLDSTSPKTKTPSREQMKSLMDKFIERVTPC